MILFVFCVFPIPLLLVVLNFQSLSASKLEFMHAPSLEVCSTIIYIGVLIAHAKDSVSTNNSANLYVKNL